MMDEIYDRSYQESRGQLNAALLSLVGRFSRSVGTAFEVLNRIEYNSPWTAKAKRVRCN